MCNGGSSNPLKDPLYWLVKQDSRGAAEVGRALGLDFLRDEGKYNQKNPGHAITKAAEMAATMYVGGLMGGGATSAAANAGYDAATAGMTAAEIAAQEAAMSAAMEGGYGAGGLLAQGAGDAATQGASLIPEGANAMQAAAPVTDLSLPPVKELSTNAGLLDRGYAKLADTARGLLSPSTPGGISSGGGKGASQLAMNMGMKMMSPQQAPQQAPAPPLQGSSQPLNNPYGTPQGNSMGMDQPLPGETYEQFMRRKRGMHVR